MFFFFQAEDGIRDLYVTGVQTCALPIWPPAAPGTGRPPHSRSRGASRGPPPLVAAGSAVVGGDQAVPVAIGEATGLATRPEAAQTTSGPGSRRPSTRPGRRG